MLNNCITPQNHFTFNGAIIFGTKLLNYSFMKTGRSLVRLAVGYTLPGILVRQRAISLLCTTAVQVSIFALQPPGWKCARDRARTRGISTVLRVIAPRFLARLTPFLALIALILAKIAARKSVVTSWRE